MKKISLLLVVLLAAGSAGLYGQMAIGTNFQISGDAKTTAGYDIDDERFGFKNDASANIKIELVSEATTTNSMDDMMEPGWVGWIELKDFKIVIDSDDEDSDLRYNASKDKCKDADGDGLETDQKAINECTTKETSRSGLIIEEPEITAKIKNGPLFLQIHSAPENKADLVAHIEDDEPDEDDPMGDRRAEGDDDGKDVGIDLGGQGVALGYDSGDLRVVVGVTSDLPWDSDKDADTGSFVVSGDVGVALGPAGLRMQIVQGIQGKNDTDASADDTGFGAELRTSFGEGRAITLKAGAAVVMTQVQDDEDTPENESMDYEFGASADVALVSMGENSTTVGAKYIMSSKKDVASDVKVTLADNGGLVDRLGMGLTWGMFDLQGGDKDATDDLMNNQSDMFLEGKLSYKLDAMGGALTPEATVTLNQVDGTATDVGLKVAAVLTDAVPATEFGLQWETTRLTDIETAKGTTDEALSGAVTAWAKIVYG